MAHGAMIAVHAAAAAARAKTQVLDAFRIAGATAPERARPLAELGVDGQNRAFAELLKAGVVRGVDSRGRLTVLGDAFDRVAGYYLDEVAFVAHRDGGAKGSQQKALVVVAILLGIVAAGLAALISQGR